MLFTNLVHHVRDHLRVLNTLHLGSRHNSVVFPGDVVNNSAILVMRCIGDSPENIKDMSKLIWGTMHNRNSTHSRATPGEAGNVASPKFPVMFKAAMQIFASNQAQLFV
jgi:hypothetical protein